MSGELLAILAVLVFVVSNAMFRRVEVTISPMKINAFRTTIGGITFFLIVVFTGLLGFYAVFPAILWVMLFLSIFFGQVLGDTFYFLTQERIGTTKALSVSMTFPFFTFIISAVLLSSTIPFSFILSAVLICFGVLLISRGKQPAGSGNDGIPFINKAAIITGFIASISWALGAVLTEKAMTDISSLTGLQEGSTLLGNSIRFPFAALLLIVWINRGDHSSQKITEWEREIWVIMLVSAFLGTIIGAFLYTEALRLAGAPLVSIIATSSPLFALPISWVINREKMNKEGFVGALLTIGGVMLVLI